jgi:hypothetical protein
MIILRLSFMFIIARPQGRVFGSPTYDAGPGVGVRREDYKNRKPEIPAAGEAGLVIQL